MSSTTFAPTHARTSDAAPAGANPWVALVGTRAAGKLETVATLVEALRAADLPAAGFVQHQAGTAAAPLGYDLVEVGSGARIALARASSQPRLCSWGFRDAAFAEARRRTLTPAAAAVVVEVGLLEAAGEGHWETVREALDGPPRLVILTIRPSVLGRVAVRLPDPAAGLELPAAPGELHGFVAEVIALARERSRAPRSVQTSTASPHQSAIHSGTPASHPSR
jgi:nucleoside-triphosphatase THEP1